MKPGCYACVCCGGPNIRRAHVQSQLERLKMSWGVYPFRCADCGKRFPLSVWSVSKVRYAKCPRCLGLRLSTWSGRRYRLSAWQKILVYLGAERYHCSACRHPFLSFRRRAVIEHSSVVESVTDGEKANNGLSVRAQPDSRVG